jgi:hypothetical protein
MRPGPEVIAAFGVRADPVSLPGGEGTAWQAGRIVLKPAGDPRVARWTGDLYNTLAERPRPGFRVPRPVSDQVAWGDRDPWSILDELAGQPQFGQQQFDQLLARALLFRLVTEMIFRRGDEAGLAAAERVGRPVSGLVLARLALW